MLLHTYFKFADRALPSTRCAPANSERGGGRGAGPGAAGPAPRHSLNNHYVSPTNSGVTPLKEAAEGVDEARELLEQVPKVEPAGIYSMAAGRDALPVNRIAGRAVAGAIAPGLTSDRSLDRLALRWHMHDALLFETEISNRTTTFLQ
jgi:hypothetical protein